MDFLQGRLQLQNCSPNCNDYPSQASVTYTQLATCLNFIVTKVVTWQQNLLHGCLFLATCLVHDHMVLQEHFHWLVLQIIVTQVARQMFHYKLLQIAKKN